MSYQALYIPTEKIKKVWLYCPNCGFQKSGVYFNPLICPRCKNGLRTLRLTKTQQENYGSELLKMGCKPFVKKYFVRGNFVEPI